MQRVSCLAAGFLLFVRGGLCAGQEIPGIIVSSDHWAENRDSRRAEAGKWLAEVAKLEKQIPTLSPAEEAWLKAECDDEIKREGHMTPRASRALFSREGTTRSAKPVAQTMVSILESLSAPSGLSESNEILLWTRLAYFALDSNFWEDLARLGEYKILVRDPETKLTNDEYGPWLRLTWALRARAILGQILLPHLNRPVSAVATAPP